MRHVHQWPRSLAGMLLVALTCLPAGARVAAAAPARPVFLDLQPLTPQQRLEDFSWIVSNFEEFYAPLNYKESHWNFLWDAKVAEYRRDISEGYMSHRQFAALMQKFVSEVHDGHTALTTWREATMDGGDMRVSALGFHTARKLLGGTDGVYIIGLLPGFFPGNSAPVQVGDKIVAIDGRSVETIYKEDLQPYQTTGREDSDVTMLARSLAFRVSTMWPMRPDGAAQVTFVRGGKVHEVRLDWVDASLSDLYYAERAENGDMQSAPAAMAQGKVIGRTQDSRWIVQVEKRPSWRHLMQLEQSGVPDIEHQLALQPHVAFFNALGRKAERDNDAAAGTPKTSITVDGLPFRLLKTKRGTAAIYRVEDFVFSRLRCGPPVEVDESFAFAICDELSGEDYGRAFNKLADMGVADLILDLRRNGGGLLTFSDNLMRAFAQSGIPAQSATVRVNESWLGEFVALGGGRHAPLASRAVYREQEKILRRDIAHKQRTSSPVHLQGLRTLSANAEATSLRTHVLIDELCASACDLFAAGMQDNKLARILGRRSMGAGGNVIRVGESPHEKLALTQTASLFYRADGSFVENAGVKPDIEIPSHVEGEIWPMVVQAIEIQ